MNRACGIGWALVLACACAEPEELAQTVVWIDADPGAQSLVERVRVEVSGPMDNTEPAVESRNPKWPIKLVLAPKHGDPGRSFKLRVDAFGSAEKPLHTLRLASGFVARQTRYAKLIIHDACLEAGASCGAGKSCTPWDIEIAADELGTDWRVPRKLSAPCLAAGATLPDDAGVDAGPPTGNTNAGRAGTGGVAPVAGTSGSPGNSACMRGFKPTANGCDDIDECGAPSPPCGTHGTCRNVPGDYVCQCEAGYQSLNGTCVTSDDCQVGNGGCEGTCRNAMGTVSCSCGKDEWLKVDRKACGGFGAPARVSSGGSLTPMEPAFAFDGAGNGLAVWIQSDGTSAGVWLRRYVAGQGWAADPEQLPLMASGVPTGPRVALDAKGEGVVVWTQSSNSDGDIWACRYSGTSCSKPGRIDEDGTGSAYDAVLQIDADGTGFAAWAQLGTSGTHIWANRFAPDRGWSGATSVSDDSEARAMGPRLALGANGHATLAWMQTSFSQNAAPRITPLIARFDATSKRWHSAVELDEDGFGGFPDPRLFGADGSAVAVWPRTSGDGQVFVHASRYTPASGWGHAVDISRGSDIMASVLPRLALGANGDGAAVWSELHDSMLSVWANRYDAAKDKWAVPKQLSSMPSGTGPLPQLALHSTGDGFAVWSEHRGTSRKVEAWRFQAGEGFTSGVTLSEDTTAQPSVNSPVQVAVDPHGNALAIWDVWESGRNFYVAASTFE